MNGTVAASVAHRGEAGRQVSGAAVDRLQDRETRGPREALAEVVRGAGHAQVHVAVDQAGQQPQTSGVDALRVGWDLHSGSRAAGGDVIVLDEHDRAVHDQAEVDRAEAHQVAGQARDDHADECPEHRQRHRDFELQRARRFDGDRLAGALFG